MNTVRDSARLTSTLTDSIRNGKIEVGSFLPTVRELSEAHGVAHNTAWRVLKTLVRQGLVEAQPRKGFRVVGDVKPVVKPIAYVLSRENVFGGWDLLYRNLLHSFEQLATRKQSYVVKLIMSAGEEHIILDHLKKSSLSGLVVDVPNTKLLQWADQGSLPTVIVDDWSAGLRYDTVVQDNFSGGQLAAQHLLSKGCRRIAWFGKKLDHYHAHLRYCGSQTAIAAAGSSFVGEHFLEIDEAGMVQSAVEMLARTDRPDGVLALWRPMTRAIAKAARRLGLKIGSDIHVVGWINEEALQEGYLNLFDDGPVPPAIVWRAADMAEVAMDSLALRAASLNRPRVCHQVPVRLWQQA